MCPVFFRIQAEYGPGKTPYLDTFHAASTYFFSIPLHSSKLVYFIEN